MDEELFEEIINFVKDVSEEDSYCGSWARDLLKELMKVNIEKLNIIKWFEELTNEGYCPALIHDDNGHWAVSFDGFQNVPMGDEPQDTRTTFWVEKRYWKNSILEAVEYAKKEIDEEMEDYQ